MQSSAARWLRLTLWLSHSSPRAPAAAKASLASSAAAMAWRAVVSTRSRSPVMTRWSAARTARKRARHAPGRSADAKALRTVVIAAS